MDKNKDKSDLRMSLICEQFVDVLCAKPLERRVRAREQDGDGDGEGPQ